MEDKDLIGVVVSLVTDKGYGFIKVPGYEKDVFLHTKNCLNSIFDQLRKGDKVHISEITTEEKGYVAKDVSLVK